MNNDNTTKTLRKGKHFLRFTFNDSKPAVRIFENWDGNIQNVQEMGIFTRTIKKETARQVWHSKLAEGYKEVAA